MEMECELLILNFRNPKTIDLINKNIGRASDGSSSHSANAFKLGLKKAFDLKKQKQQPPPPPPAGYCDPHSTWEHLRTSSHPSQVPHGLPFRGAMEEID